MDAFSPLNFFETARADIHVTERAAAGIRQLVQVGKSFLHITGKANSFQFLMKLRTMSAVAHMDHFMAQEREQFRKRTVLKEATDADEPLCPVTTSPGGNHAVRPFTTEYRKLSTPVFLVQL